MGSWLLIQLFTVRSLTSDALVTIRPVSVNYLGGPGFSERTVIKARRAPK